MLLDYVSPLTRQYAVVMISNLSVFYAGMSLVWTSPMLSKLRSETQTVLSRPITEDEASWIVAIPYLVGIFSNSLGSLVDLIGRKSCIILSVVPRLITCLISTFATEVWMLLLSRAINGFADSITFPVVAIYSSEIASKEIRGTLGTILQITSSLGVVFMLSVGPFTPYFLLNVIFTCIVLFTAVPLLFLPESPYYLYSKGRTADALKLLTSLRGSKLLANEEMKQYTLTANVQKVDKIQLFKNKNFLKSLCITVILSAGTQLIGFNTVTFYLQTILESTRTNISPEIASVIIGLIQLIASFFTSFVADKCGRKSIMIITLAGMAAGMIGLGTFFELRGGNDQPLVGFMNFLPLISLIMVVFCYSSGLGSIYWSLMPELFDSPSRGFGISISLCILGLASFTTIKCFSMLTIYMGPATTYWFFTTNCLLICMFTVFCVPETKGKTFAEIQNALSNNKVV